MVLYTFLRFILLLEESLFLLLYSLFESNLSIRGHFLTCELFLWSQLRLPILSFLHFSTCAFAFRRSASYLYEVILQLFIKFMNCALKVFFSYLSKIAGSYNEADKYQEVFHMLRNLHRSCKRKRSFLTYELYQRILYYYLFLKIFNIFFNFIFTGVFR